MKNGIMTNVGEPQKTRISQDKQWQTYRNK